MEFTDEYLKKLLKKIFGFNNFKDNQNKIIKSVLKGNNTFVIMPTGGGKSMCYQLPALINKGTAIIVSPLIALMKNQVDVIRNYGTNKSIAHVMNSSLSKVELLEVKEDLLNGKTKLLYVAPETLTKEDNILFFKNLDISFYAIDEAHCISEWGHDFRPEYRKIKPTIDKIGKKVPVIALTATATPKVQQDILKNLEMLDADIYISSFNRPNLYYEVRPKTKNVIKDIIKYIKTQKGKSGIIYCLSRKKVEELAETLVVNGIKALPYHAGLDSATRKKNQENFLMEDANIIVATIAFGMGIDKPDVRFVIHHDIPKSLEGYYQETGRAGRDGGEGNCIAFYSYDDILKLEKFSKGKPVAEQEISKQLLLEVVSYTESSVCRRQQLLHYFGESYDAKDCQCCDNCLHPKSKFEGKEYLIILLEAVIEVKQLFKAQHIVNILTGENTAALKAFKHNTLKSFARGMEKNQKFWNALIRQALINNFLEKDIENYGLLKVTEKTQEFLDNPHSFMITKDHDYDSEDGEFVDASHSTGSSDEALFKMLKDLRKDIAKKDKLPPFVIFQDPSLEDMSIQYPITLDEMKQITGVGIGKATKYGKPFIELISKYVEENEIIRPMDMVVKSVVNKSGMKVQIIQNIDRKLSLEDIANSLSMSINELLTEIEHIVSSGTRLNIDYYINEYIDLYHQEDIYDYFIDSDSDSIDDALEELGADEFSEEEIRLMRIKFISEVGN